MADFVTLTCPSCGEKLQITSDLERFACMYCGREHLVKRSGGVVSLVPVIEQPQGIPAPGESPAREGPPAPQPIEHQVTEAAIVRLRTEIDTLESHKAAILRNTPKPHKMAACGCLLGLMLFCMVSGGLFITSYPIIESPFEHLTDPGFILKMLICAVLFLGAYTVFAALVYLEWWYRLESRLGPVKKRLGQAAQELEGYQGKL
jgi:DNA-directed RNA polymerase subunit RPC12/RpoP